MLYNLMFSATHRRAIAWHRFLLWPRHKWWGDHVDCTLTVNSTKPPVAIQSVYCLKCWLIAALLLFTVVEPIPALLTEPSGLQTSANQPLVSTQFVTVFSSWPASNKLKLPSLLSLQSPSAGKKTAWTECAWFISNVLNLYLWISNFSSLNPISMLRGKYCTAS